MVHAVVVAALLACADAGGASSLRGADAALAVLRRADRGPLNELSQAIHAAEEDLRGETAEEEDVRGHGHPVPAARLEDVVTREIKYQPAPRIEDAETRQIQHEVENMAHRVKSLRDRDARASADLTRELDGIEEVLGESARDSGLREEIVTMRADLCTQQGYMSHEFASCEGFMRKACIPADISQVALPPDVPEGFCLLFFKEEAATAGEIDAIGPVPGPAPVPAPGFEVLFGGKAARPLPEQGLAGDTVPPHKHWDTMITNWQREYGPGHRSPEKICKDHCPNEWCQIHGFCGVRKPEIKTVVVEKEEEESEASAGPIPGSPHHSGTVPRSGSICVSLVTALVAAVAALA